jgi:hypothetical protein
VRFIAEGPSIPDSLLHARDEGRVVFFCGAGVSRARAGLADFFGLAASVIQKLGAPEDCDASKVLRKAKKVSEELDVTGLISADRVFSLLERDFTTLDIQSAVAKSLATAADVDRSAHEILLRLARTPSGKTQLVTTNFDRLFEFGTGEVRSYQPPRLPQPSRYDDLDGIVYLHGRVDAAYTRADGDELVLSSSDFGHAYLSEGWATQFFREIVRKYVVVFVGYSADDPPVHYLLEGLRRQHDSQYEIYAFQSDESTELTARWQHKRVQPIAYSNIDDHRALWETLELWAIRADNPQAWRQSALDRSMAGPRDLKPHERGQVAHIVSTYEGARAFAEVSPPADWLCVFDPQCRFERSRRLDYMTPDSAMIDPFALFGLDFDEIPQRSGDDSFVPQRDVPSCAWDAFAINESDRQDLPTNCFSAVRGHSPLKIPNLPPRLSCLGKWIANVAHQAAAVWWAARQVSLHPSLRREIEWGLSQRHKETDGEILRVWSYLLEAWNNPHNDEEPDWFNFNRDIDRDGWSLVGVRRLVKLMVPYLTVGPGLMSRPVPPRPEEEFRMNDLARIKVECPVPPIDVDIPEEWLYQTVRGLRSCLEDAARLYKEVDDHQGRRISPLEEDDHPDICDHQRTQDLSGFVITFASLYKRLTAVDVQRAMEELAAWPSDDDLVFARLRFWANGKPELATSDAFARVVLELTDNVFWGSYHQRDLLILLAKRWSDIADHLRHEIEARILAGPSRYDGEEDDSYREHAAWSVLMRLNWLKKQGCQFSFDVESEISRRRRDAPSWKPEIADHAAESLEIRGGVVATDTEHGALVREPIDTILSKTLELSGRSDSNQLVEYDPFAGLCSARPKRAYLALTHAARRRECPEWGWKTFLSSDSREKDPSAFSTVIATRLCRLSKEMLSALLFPATMWLQKISKAISTDSPNVFDKIVQRLIDVVKAFPDRASFAVIGSSRGTDWVTDATNSPVGHLILAVFDDTRYQDVAAIHAGLRPVELCLALPGNPRRHAIAMASHHLGRLHANAADWAEQHLLTVIDGQDVEDQDAFWAGFFWNPKITSPALYLRIKVGLMKIAKDRTPAREGHEQSLAFLLLIGWISSADNEDRRWVSDSELRDVLLHGGDEFRSHILRQFEKQLRNGDARAREEWQTRTYKFFEAVWPMQRSVKTPEMSARIVDVLVAHSDSFRKLIDLVSPLLTTIRDATQLRLQFRDETKTVIKAHPERFLHLLNVVLPEDVRYWPYGINNAIDLIAEADESLLTDARLRELQRRWDTR